MYLKHGKKIVLLYYDTSHDFSLVFGLVLIHRNGLDNLLNLWMQLKINFSDFINSLSLLSWMLLNHLKLDQTKDLKILSIY